LIYKYCFRFVFRSTQRVAQKQEDEAENATIHNKAGHEPLARDPAIIILIIVMITNYVAVVDGTVVDGADGDGDEDEVGVEDDDVAETAEDDEAELAFASTVVEVDGVTVYT